MCVCVCVCVCVRERERERERVCAAAGALECEGVSLCVWEGRGGGGGGGSFSVFAWVHLLFYLENDRSVIICNTYVRQVGGQTEKQTEKARVGVVRNNRGRDSVYIFFARASLCCCAGGRGGGGGCMSAFLFMCIKLLAPIKCGMLQ